MRHLLAAILAASLTMASAIPAQRPLESSHIRVNHVGYIPDAPKVAVVCSLQPTRLSTFHHHRRTRSASARAAPGAPRPAVRALDHSTDEPIMDGTPT
ncbi:MAG: hypothetical protein KY464_01230 [Gemmatimonadetes bacterium]|nr:hypothetical protein [Gemmatimonadota bacterium]